MKFQAYKYGRLWPVRFEYLSCYQVEVTDFLFHEFRRYDVTCLASEWLLDNGYDVSDLISEKFLYFGSYIDVYLIFKNSDLDKSFILFDEVVLRCKLVDYE